MLNPPQILQTLIFLSFIFLFPTLTTSLSAPTFNGKTSHIIPFTSLGYQYLELTSNTSALFTLQAQDWTASASLTTSLVTNCGGSQLLAGIGVLPAGKYLQRYYPSLPTHNAILFQIRFWIIDNWQSFDNVTVSFDSQNVYGQNMYYGKFIASSNLCGSSIKDLAYYTITGKILHSAQTLTLQITSSLTGSPTSASFGVRDISIILRNTSLLTSQSCYRGFDNYVYGAPGECDCIRGKYPNPYDSSSCLTCPTGCADCYGSSLSLCYICSSGYSYIQGTCRKCDNTCETCSGTSPNQCITCSSGYWLQNNGTCMPTCNLPSYAYQEVDDLKLCITPCDSTTKYLLEDGTCASSCSSSEYEVIIDDNYLCLTPTTPTTPPSSGCASGEFLYANDSICRSSCPSPFIQDDSTGIDICKFPCPDTNDFYYYDGSCSSTCPSPLVQSVEWTGLKRCNLPCSDNKYLYPNGSCYQDCTSPSHTTTVNGVNKCVAPCTNSQDYYYEATKTCSSTCTFPDTSSEIDSIRLCTAGLSESEAAQVKEIAGLNEQGGAIASTAATVASVVSSSNPKALSLASLDKMLKYIRYIGVNYPTKVRLMFHEEEESHSGISISFSPSLPDSVLHSFPKHHLPENFEQYELPSSFIVNCWKLIGTLSIVLLVIGFSTVGAHFTKKFKYVYFVFSKIQAITRWDFFLIIFYSSCDGFAFFSSMEFRGTHLNSFPAVISFITCIVANLIAIFVIAKTFYIIWDIRKTHTKRTIPNSYNSPPVKLHNRWENYHVIYGAFKNKSFLQQGFIFFYVLRIYLFNIIIGYLFDHPLCQGILIVLLSILMLLYLAINRPFHSPKELIQMIILETPLFIVNIVVLILAILDLHEIEASTSRYNLGEVIIYANLMFTIITLLIFIVDLVLALIGLYKGFKTSKEHGLSAILHLILIFFIPEGLEVEKEHPKEDETSTFGKRKPHLKIAVEKNDDSQLSPTQKQGQSPYADSPIDLSANDSSDNLWIQRKHLLAQGASVSQFAPKRSPEKFLDAPSPTLSISGASSPRNTDRDDQEFGLPRSSSGEKQQLKNDIEDLRMSPNLPHQNTLSRRMLLRGETSSSTLSINQLDLLKRNSSLGSSKGGNVLMGRMPSHFSRKSVTRRGTLELRGMGFQGESRGDILDYPPLSFVQRQSSTELWREKLESWRKKGDEEKM